MYNAINELIPATVFCSFVSSAFIDAQSSVVLSIFFENSNSLQEVVVTPLDIRTRSIAIRTKKSRDFFMTTVRDNGKIVGVQIFQCTRFPLITKIAQAYIAQVLSRLHKCNFILVTLPSRRTKVCSIYDCQRHFKRICHRNCFAEQSIMHHNLACLQNGFQF